MCWFVLWIYVKMLSFYANCVTVYEINWMLQSIINTFLRRRTVSLWTDFLSQSRSCLWVCYMMVKLKWGNIKNCTYIDGWGTISDERECSYFVIFLKIRFSGLLPLSMLYALIDPDMIFSYFLRNPKIIDFCSLKIAKKRSQFEINFQRALLIHLWKNALLLIKLCMKYIKITPLQ